MKDENGTEYTVLTEVDSRREAFADFYTNKKTSQSARKTRSEEARDIDNSDVSDAKLQKVSEYDKEETEKIFDAAKKRFGVTNDMREAGYILPDGTMLDFTGKHQMDDGIDTSFLNGRRSVDHRDIKQLNYETDGNTETGLNVSMEDFVERGAVRIDANVGVINLSARPTKEQRDMISRLIRRNGGDVSLEIGMDGAVYAEYDGASTAKVLADIDRYFDEGIKPQGDIRYFRTKDGQAYGFTLNGEIYLDPRIATVETPIHEYGHLWSEALREVNPKAWEQLKKEMFGEKDVLDFVTRLYPELKGDDLAEEVFTHFAGKRGAERLRAEQKRMLDENATDILKQSRIMQMFSKLRNLLNEYWQKARDLFAGKVEGIENMTGEQFADMMLSDLMGGFNPNEVAKKAQGVEKAEGVIKAQKADEEGDSAMLSQATEEDLDKEYMSALNVVEKPQRIEKLRNSEPVDVVFSDDYSLERRAAKKWAKENVKGTYTNADTKEEISVSNVSIDKVTSHGEREEAHLKAIKAIPQMIERSIFIDEVKNEKGSGKYDSYRYYVCGLTIDGVPYTAKVVVGVKNGRRYYDHELTQIEKGELIDSLNGIAKPVAENNSPISGYKDKRLLSILQTNSEEIARAEEKMREIRDEKERRKNGIRFREADESRTSKAHNYEVTKIELLEAPSGDNDVTTEPVAMTSNNSISSAKLLQGVEKSYDKGKNLLDESEKSALFRESEDAMLDRLVDEMGYFAGLARKTMKGGGYSKAQRERYARAEWRRAHRNVRGFAEVHGAKAEAVGNASDYFVCHSFVWS